MRVKTEDGIATLQNFISCSQFQNIHIRAVVLFDDGSFKTYRIEDIKEVKDGSSNTPKKVRKGSKSSN